MNLDIKLEEELQRNEYLGTFRWKNVNFHKLIPFTKNEILLKHKEISSIFTESWKEYLNFRTFDLEIEPKIIDALSFPLSVIQIIDYIYTNINSFKDILKVISNNIKNNIIIPSKTTFNIILIGSANKTEERIALESNYFEEIYYYCLSLLLNQEQVQDNKDLLVKYFNINICFTGEEVKSNNTYSSKDNPNVKYGFYSLKTKEFLKENSMDFTKRNSIVIGMNCGFGAGYSKLTLSWIRDLHLMFKLGYVSAFTYTNDYEDLKGEMLILEYLKVNILMTGKENKFKCMSVYKTEEDKDETWSCGNFGFYVVGDLKSNVGIEDEKVIGLLKDNGLLKL